MAFPVIIVECAFTTNPADTPSWTDISDYVREFSTNRGRQRDQDRFMAGRVTLVLSNEDRRFDNTYVSGPYYPNVIPMRRIRIRATFAAVTYAVFSGFIDTWGQTYQGPGEALCDVSATDGFGFLVNIDLPDSVYEAEVRADTPTGWWRFDDPVGSSVAIAAAGVGADGAVSGAPVFGTAGLVTRDANTAVAFPGGAVNDAIVIASAAAPSGATFTVEFVWKSTTQSGSFAILNSASGAGTDINLTINGGTLTFIDATSTVDVDDNAPHHIALVFTLANRKIYIDGVDRTSGGVGAESARGAGPLTVGNANGGNTSSAGTIDELAWYPSSLSTTRIADHSAARATPWNNDTSGARIGRILDLAGWPAADRNIDTGVAILQSASLGGTALAALQKVEETEQGRLFIDAAGKVRFIARDNLLKTPYTVSQATFGDSGSELGYETISIDPGAAQTVVNEARVSRLNGVTQVASDAGSIVTYLKRTKTVDGLLHQSDATSRDLANWIVAHGKDPFTRIVNMAISAPTDETNLYPQVLGRELSDRLTIRKRPQNLGAAIEQAALIEGEEHRVTAAHWDTRWNLSPAETQTYWILGVAGSSELGVSTRMGF